LELFRAHSGGAPREIASKFLSGNVIKQTSMPAIKGVDRELVRSIDLKINSTTNLGLITH
jgi:hypothetical protein